MLRTTGSCRVVHVNAIPDTFTAIAPLFLLLQVRCTSTPLTRAAGEKSSGAQSPVWIIIT